MPIQHHDYVESNINLQAHTPPAKQSSILVSLILKPIIMLFILSIFLFIGIFAVSTIFFLLAVSSLHLCRRRRRRCRRSMQTISTVQLQQHLPSFLYETGVKTNKECAVCLESFEAGEWCRRLAGCNHVFHVSCVDSWLAKVLNCPVCRAPLRFNSRASLSCDFSSRQQSDDEFKLLWAGV